MDHEDILNDELVLDRDSADGGGLSRERHRSPSARSRDNRHQQDPLRQDPSSQTHRTSDNTTLVPVSQAVNTPEPDGRGKRRVWVRDVLLSGVVIFVVGFVAWQQLSPNDEEPVTTEVAGEAIESDATDTDERDEVEPAVNEPETSSEAPADDEVIDSEATDEVESEAPTPAEDGVVSNSDVIGEIELVEIADSLEDLNLVVYDVDPTNGGTRSFAIRVANSDSEGELIPTAGFEVQLETQDGERIDAIVRFVHADVPPGSSAIASVRVEGVPDGAAQAVLVHDGVDIDSVPLP